MGEDTTEKPTIKFRPLEIPIPKGEIIQTPQGRKLELIFQSTPISEDAPDLVQLKAQAEELLGAGYDYFRSLVGEDFDLTERFMVKFTQGRFRHAGILMHMDVDLLRELNKNPDHQYTQDLVKSLVVHEIGHNLTVEEDIPMFAEMIYMVERGQIGRLMDINRLLSKGKLEQAHVKGLIKISQWLGYSSPSEMLTNFPQRSLSELKAVFRNNLGEGV